MLPQEFLQKLISFDTSNPPGDVRKCIEYISEFLKENGIKSDLYYKDYNRPNLIARVKGRSQSPALLLYGHIDVVPVDDQNWSVDPFGGVIKDNCIWGRGALDMKGGLTMLIYSLVNAHITTPSGDVVLCVLADEETGGEFGASYLVDNHSEHFLGIHHAIGEFGAFNFNFFGTNYFPIQVDEKQFHKIKVEFSSLGGHSAIVNDENALVLASEYAIRVSKLNWPNKCHYITKMMLRKMGEDAPFLIKIILYALQFQLIAKFALKLIGASSLIFKSLLSSTVTPTIIRSGSKINVVPSKATVEFDVRLLPGDSLDSILEVMKNIAPYNSSISVTSQERVDRRIDLSQLQLTDSIIKEVFPGAKPIPFVLPGVTDARHFNRLNIQSYGFLPMMLPKNIKFFSLIHSADERIPVSAIDAGIKSITTFIERYKG